MITNRSGFKSTILVSAFCLSHLFLVPLFLFFHLLLDYFFLFHFHSFIGLLATIIIFLVVALGYIYIFFTYHSLPSSAIIPLCAWYKNIKTVPFYFSPFGLGAIVFIHFYFYPTILCYYFALNSQLPF